MNCYRCATPLPDDARFCLSCGADVSGEAAQRTLPAESDPELQIELQADIGTDFLIERELGRGGMAVVFLATDVHLGRKVAVKLLPPELTLLSSGGMVERFKREARTAATLDHPHIIPIYRISTGGKLFWYVMKYLEGESLDGILKRERQLPLERTAEILKQVAEALGYASRKNVIHRDVKPANVMLDADGWVTVMDFGIAKALDTVSLTGSGSIIGTPYYMSPEQCSGTKVTGASDQYSLGVMAYQMVSGHLPFAGETVVEIIKKHCMEVPPPLSILRPDLPPLAVSAIERALSKDPGSRFGTVTEFADAFGQAAERRSIPTTVVVPRRPAAKRTSHTVEIAPSSKATPVTSPGVAGKSGSRGLALVVKLAVVLAIGGVVSWPTIRGALPTRSSQAAAPPHAARPANAVRADSNAAAAGASRPTDTVPGPVAAAPSNWGTIVLRGAAPGMVLSLDGRRVRGAHHAIEAGRRHVLTATLGGYQTWIDTFTIRGGETLTQRVRMRPSAQQQVAAAIPPPSAPPLVQPSVPAQAAESASRPPGVAYLSVGSRPPVAMSINGRPAPGNPVVGFEVQAGVVRLQFAATDSTAALDTTISVAIGEHRNQGRIELHKKH